MDQIHLPLAKQKWEKVSIHLVYHAFLKAEFHKCINFFGAFANAHRNLVENPDFENEFQNCKRACLLAFRAPLLFKIPCSTVWYKMTSLRQFHLNDLRVIGRCGYDDVGDQNELLNVAKRIPEKLKTPANYWHTPILWGHSKEGPFTIIEGNHRLIAFASLQNSQELDIPVYIGLSSEYCYWHLSDPVN